VYLKVKEIISVLLNAFGYFTQVLLKMTINYCKRQSLEFKMLFTASLICIHVYIRNWCLEHP